jgi:hypothetical protein
LSSPPLLATFFFLLPIVVLPLLLLKENKKNPIVLFMIATKQQLFIATMEISGTCFSNQDDDHSTEGKQLLLPVYVVLP